MVNVEALKKAWHSSHEHAQWLEKGLAYRRTISMAGRALASSQLDGCYGPLECLHQPGPDFRFQKRSFGKKTVVQR